VGEQADLAPYGPSVGAKVVAEDDGLAPDDRRQPGECPEKGRLARSVGSPEQHDLASIDIQIDSGEGRETAEQADGSAEVDSSVHGQINAIGGVSHPPRRDPGTAADRYGLYVQLYRVVGAAGRTLIALGVLILLFVVYQLWGTGLQESRAQDRLRDEFEDLLADVPSITTTTTDGTDGDASTTTTEDTAPPAPPEGQAVAILKIPRIGLEKIIVEGVSLSDLKKAPGHYPDTPLPGQPGNAAIAGHRTTYGAPFWDLNEVQPGDPILVTTRQGRFRYEVTNSFVVAPSAVEVLNPTDDSILTLTTCNPRFSARQRLIVQAELIGEAAAGPATTVPTETTTTTAPDDPESTTTTTLPRETVPADLEGAGLSGEGASNWPTVLWGALAALIWLVTWLLSRRWRKWPAYLIGTPVFLVVLFVFYENVSRLLPANV